MKDLLKHTIACRIAGCLAVFCLAFVSCTSTVDDGPQDSRAITFQAPQADTRAVVENGERLPADFRVWGWHGTDGTNTDNIFDATVVYKNAGWNYTDGVRYWKSGEIYNFYAVYPVFPLPTGEGDTQTTSTVTTGGTITVTNFDCSKTGTEAVDLMTATATGITYTAEQTPQPVVMEFSHLLAKVEFVGKSEGGNATVNKLVLGNIFTKGTYDDSSASLWSNLTSQDITISNSTDLTSDGENVSDDMLLIPQTLTSPQLTVTYSTDTETNRTETYTLPIDIISSWMAGQSYRYTFTITGGGYIIFDAPTVNKWGSATGGSITIDVTEPNS